MAASKTPAAVSRSLLKLGDDISTWRKLHRLTAAEFADRAGVEANTVLRLENGPGADLEHVLRYARCLGAHEGRTG